MRRLLVASTFAFLVTRAPPAGAQPAPPPADAATDARSAFDAGQKLYDAGKLAEAHDLFARAYEASKSPNARLMVARCLVGLGRLPEAYDEMSGTSRDATARAETDPKYVPTRDAAASELALLERRIAKVTIVIVDFAVGTEITINGARVPPERIGFPIAVMPGRLVIRVVTPASASNVPVPPIEREINAGAGEVQTVAISAPKAVDRPVVVEPSRFTPVRSAGIVVAGLGVVGMAVFAGAGVASNAKFHSLQQSCGNQRCTDPADASVVDSGKTLDAIANAALGVGLVGVVGGGLMIAFGGPRKAPKAAGGVNGLVVSTGSARVPFVTTTKDGVALSF